METRLTTYFLIPTRENDYARRKGAAWDNTLKLWYAPDAQTADALRNAGYPVAGTTGTPVHKRTPRRAE